MAEKYKNRFIAFILAVLMLALPSFCLAEQNSGVAQLNIECCLLAGETLSVIVHTNMEASKTKFSAMLDSFELGVSAASKYETEGGTSYLVFVDLGGVSEKDISKLEALAKAAAALVGKNDNIAIMPLGALLNKNSFTSAKSAIDAQLALIKPLEGEKTDLYSGIAQAAKLFDSTIGVKPARKLIIISNGKNEGALGVTLEEAAKTIEQSGISVCTIGILADKNANSEAISALGSLARRSVGGQALTLDNSQQALTDACEKVRALDEDTYLLHYDLTGIEIENIYSNLLVTASAAGVEVKSDIDVDMRQLISERRENAPSPEPTQAPIATPALAAATPSQTEAAPSQAPVAGIDADMSKAISDKTVIWAIIDGAAVIGVLILVAVIAKRRRRAADGEDDDLADGPACYMTLARLTGSRFSYKQAFTSSMTIGRSAREAELVLLDEETVAPTHCRIDVAGNRLSVISLDAGYDTMVNGEAVGTRQKLLLRQGDVLELGELKLKLRWYMR